MPLTPRIAILESSCKKTGIFSHLWVGSWGDREIGEEIILVVSEDALNPLRKRIHKVQCPHSLSVLMSLRVGRAHGYGETCILSLYCISV